MDKPRQIALQTLYEIEKNNAYSNIKLDENINKNIKMLKEKDISFISQIVYGVITWKITLDEIIKKYSSIKIKKISIWILNILRMGIYQIVFLDKIPNFATINESVELAKRYGHIASSRFVNAILRKVSKEDYEQLFNIKDEIEKISKTTSTPIWLVKQLVKERNVEDATQICNNLNQKPELIVRVNSIKITKEEFMKKLEERKIQYEELLLKDFLVIKNLKQIEKFDLFKEGYFIVQDQSAGLAAYYLNPKKNQKILDACSAPGGKTTYLAQLMRNTGEIIALEKYQHRISLVEQNIKRLGIKNVKTIVQDATTYNKNLKNKFDKILLDVPCMGIGVIKRKPDIKWQRTEEDIEEITKDQKNILQVCSKYLKVGGEIVYSTCSILKKENEDVIKEFLQENPNFKIKKEEFEELKNIDIFNINQGMININPQPGFDGFFICKLEKFTN